MSSFFTNKNNDLQRGKGILPALHSYQIEELQPEPTNRNIFHCDSVLTIGMHTDCSRTPSKLGKSEFLKKVASGPVLLETKQGRNANVCRE